MSSELEQLIRESIRGVVAEIAAGKRQRDYATAGGELIQLDRLAGALRADQITLDGDQAKEITEGVARGAFGSGTVTEPVDFLNIRLFGRDETGVTVWQTEPTGTWFFWEGIKVGPAVGGHLIDAAPESAVYFRDRPRVGTRSGPSDDVALMSDLTGAAGPRSGPALPDDGGWLSVHNTYPTRNATPAAVPLAANRLYGTPIRLTRAANLDSFAFRVTTAGASTVNGRWGMYRIEADGRTLTRMVQSGTDPNLRSVGWKQIDYPWEVFPPGDYLLCILASGAVSLAGMAAIGVSESPFHLGAWSPVTSYTNGSAIPTAYGVNRPMAFSTANWPTTITLADSDIVDAALPACWAYFDPA